MLIPLFSGEVFDGYSSVQSEVIEAKIRGGLVSA